MKKLLIVFFVLFGCSATKYTAYKVTSENFYTREKTFMETIDINDAIDVYKNLTGNTLDTTKIDPFYDERTDRYYFYVERKMLKRTW